VKFVPDIHAKPSSSAADTTPAVLLLENRGLSFMGDTKGGPFDIPELLARAMLAAQNPHGKPNSDVLRPWVSRLDVTRMPQHLWIIDFPPGMDEREAVLYEQPFEYIRRHVQPKRADNKRAVYRDRWWIHAEPQPEMRIALAKRDRFIAVPRVAEHLLFVWLPPETLPDSALTVFARDDDWFSGVLHSRFHQVWALRLGRQLREKKSGFRYTLTTCFETFPFPWPPGTPLGKLTCAQDDQRTAIAQAARALDVGRADWLGDRSDPMRTLTALYNARPGWLQQAHAALDEAVAAAYGWPADLPDDEIVTRLLALNRERAPTP
jgi:type II restriction/modification system DNA methylase subunit YeeA